jgi:DNA polymerase-3 subunit gamma/tau
MAYQSLYRRYRPRRFSDVRGQEHVIRALRNAVRDDRVGHAYLFSGPRGTGKTSTARILAKALNCENLQEGEPDGTCDSCLAIDVGTSYDVQELDAASNNKVDDIEDLIGRVNLGSPGRTKVYILDEVHMLTTAAANKLLKTLEEPPDHVVFVLATTDPQKVLPTIKSRTQHFEFHLLSAEELAEHVAWVIHDAELGLDDDVIAHVVRSGGGSARDTLSALDQVAAAGGVLDKGEELDDLLDAIAASDPGKALVAVAAAVSSGRDPRVLGEAVLARLRDVFLLRMGASTDHLQPDDVERVRAWAAQLGDRATTRALEAIGDALLEMRQAPDPRIPLEVALVKLTRADGDPSLDGLAARVAALEAALASGAVTSGAGAGAGGAAAPPAARPANPSAAPARPATPPPAPAPGPAAAVSSAPSAPPAAPPAAPSAPPPSSAPSSSAPPVPPPAAPAAAAPEADPAAGGSRPADRARAELAAKRAERAGRGGAPRPRPAPAPPASSPAPPPAGGGPAGAGSSSTSDAPTAPPRPGAPAAGPAAERAATSSTAAPASGVDAGAGDAPPPEPSAGTAAAPDAASGPSATDATAPAGSGATGGLPGPEAFAEVWNDGDLPLGGLTKAMFRDGRVVEVADGTAVLAFSNDVHRQKCEGKRPEVEKALSTRFGVPVTLRLTIDGEAAPRPRPAGGGGGRRAAEPEPEPGADAADHLGGSSVHELDDAPDAPAGGIDALTEAFPGSELVEGP